MAASEAPMAYVETSRPIPAIFVDLVNQFTALVVLLLAAVTGLAAAGLAVGWASLIVGGVALLIGLALLALGVRRLKAGRFVPTRTIARLQHDAAVAAQRMRNDHGSGARAA